MMKRQSMLVAAGLLVLACESKTPAPAAEKPPTPTAATDTPIAKAPESTVDLESVPVEEDFEEQAATELSPANLEAKLDELEKEIGAAE